MDNPTSRKQATHERILDTAAGVLRASGFQGVGVADIMKRAGLTHGGFYAHFASREALLAEALERAGEDSQVRLRRALDAGEAKGGSRFQALVDNYLADRHLRSPESGCPVAALASEMPRQPDPVREAAAARIEALTRTVAATLAPAQAREAAGVIASQLVGALQIARTLGDNAKGRRHLAASRRFLLEQFAPDNTNTPPDTTH
ncbi:TetR/AcrR family transcriptional regulator [Hydrogenophaga borbori]|uniref:TetR/AcrR family transcriptional regulator n=1 Tax=Hydrogenophaga borbori TaxID=2294117 RepID=UPI00301BE747